MSHSVVYIYDCRFAETCGVRVICIIFVSVGQFRDHRDVCDRLITSAARVHRSR